MSGGPVPIPLLQRFEDKVFRCPMSGCWLWTAGLDSSGYGIIGVKHGARNRTQKAHRVSYRLFVGSIPSDLWVLHRCDVRCCVNPKHLFLGTSDDNIKDMWNKGRYKSSAGEAQSNAILTESDVLQIRSLYATGKFLQREIAARFRCSQPNVGYIVRREAWKHLP